jgi:nucleotide-binding universal stress UspA family protein
MGIFPLPVRNFPQHNRERIFTVGHPAETIIETAKKWGSDLVALGSHGYRGFTRFLIGSVSYAVASHATCSVEIVRKPTVAEKC